jgi:tRNA threonylcarbamoyladenosine biosynthesis protein TsaB
VNLLGLDTSSAASAACVLRGDGAVFEHQPDRVEPGRRAHARELLPAAAAVLESSGLDWADLNAVGVGVGPGGFTGLRIGIATARALAAAGDAELRPVSSLAALAQGIGDPSAASPRLPLIDAGRGQVFGALYAGAEERWPPFAASPQEVAERVREAGLAPLASGDGAIRFRGLLEPVGIQIDPDASSAHAVRALHICRLAERAPARPAEAVLPDYLRSPDAKPRSE